MASNVPQGGELELRGVKGGTVVTFPAAPVLDNDHVEETALRLFHLAETIHDRTMVLNLAHVSFISSRALGVLVSLYKKLLNRQKKLVVCHVKEEIKNLFNIVCLNHLFPAYDNEAQAIQAEKQES